MKPPLVVPLATLGRASLPLAGGKAANLGELIEAGFAVPPGFCITTAAYQEAARAAEVAPLLANGRPDDVAASARAALLNAPLPETVATAVRAAYAELSDGDQTPAVAVRSSATAEDLPDASFAGQQDTFLNVVGEIALLDAVRRCWASLWTDRAVAYRAANGIDDRTVLLAVVVQRMVPAATAGVLFTANPLTGRRYQAVIDAAPGLGEAVVSGAVNPDHFLVDVQPHTWGRSPVIHSDRQRGSASQPGAAADRCLTNQQVRELARVGAAVEAHFGAPQDIEWAYAADGTLWLLQARPITTLFPLPQAARADAEHLDLYFSASVAQGVLGPLTPMGIDLLRHFGASVGRLAGFDIDPARGPSAVVSAGGRLFLNATPLVRHPLGRRWLLAMLSIGEPETGKAIRSVVHDPRLATRADIRSLAGVFRFLRFALRIDLPGGVVSALARPTAARESRLRAAEQLMDLDRPAPATPGQALDRIEALLRRMAPALTRLASVLVAGMGSFALARWIAGSIGAADEALLVTRALPHTPTTEMDLALWSLATRLRSDPAVAALLLTQPPEQTAAQYGAGAAPPLLTQEVAAFLRQYGFRGVAEIDVGVPRWRDDPTMLFAALGNYLRLDNADRAPDALFRRGASEAKAAAARIVGRAEDGAWGWMRAVALRFLFSRTRALAGRREMPKFLAMRLLGTCRELLEMVGKTLVERERIQECDDVFFLDLIEARRALGGQDFRAIVAARRQEYLREQRRRMVPRVLLSDGTTLYGAATTVQPGLNVQPSTSDLQSSARGSALIGTPASPGVYKGQARVILDPHGARIEPGEVLVAPSTDPGWTPLFLTAGALVMEMGGMMSHGAVVAREYGIPAVVGAIGATTAFTTGQELLVDGTRGIVTRVS